LAQSIYDCGTQWPQSVPRSTELEFDKILDPLLQLV